jgi:hypothetical protein
LSGVRGKADQKEIDGTCVADAGRSSMIFPLCHAFFLCYVEGRKARYINYAGKEKKDVREIW